MVFKNALIVLASLPPNPTALHVYVTGRGEVTSYVKLNVEQRSILKGPFPTVISGAVGTAGLSTATGVDAEKDERPLAVLILLAFNDTVSRGSMVGLLPKVTFRKSLVAHTHVLPEPSPVSTSTSPQAKLPESLPLSES
jgi:hypothetical protein